MENLEQSKELTENMRENVPNNGYLLLYPNRETKYYFQIRFGWDPDMQIDQFVREFDTAARVSISLWAEVTPIRVQKIQVG